VSLLKCRSADYRVVYLEESEGGLQPKTMVPVAEKPRDVLVLGAGIVGIGCALYLQRAGHALTVIDRSGPGEGCSFGNAGVIATDAIMPLATFATLREGPRMLLDPLGPLCIRWHYLPRLLPWLLRFVASARPAKLRAITQALAALQLHALEAYEPLLDHAGARDLLRTSGRMSLYVSDQRFFADAHKRDVQRRHGVRVEELDVAQVHERIPALSDKIRRGVLFPDSAYTVNPFRLVQTLADDLQRHGGIVRRATVTDVSARPGRVRVNTSTGYYEGEILVLALGAWSGRLAARLGSPVPLDTERGYHVTLPHPRVRLELPLIFEDYRFAATSMEQGLRFAGTVEFAGVDAPPNYARARVLLERAHRLLPKVQTEGYSKWMGLRPTLPDSLPVISASPIHANVYFAFGHQHLGLTLGAITGRLIADLVAGRKSDIDVTPYRIDRF
jgi:D-amino-acid dehydrogenase